jgi:hypothetical protein
MRQEVNPSCQPFTGRKNDLAIRKHVLQSHFRQIEEVYQKRYDIIRSQKSCLFANFHPAYKNIKRRKIT